MTTESTISTRIPWAAYESMVTGQFSTDVVYDTLDPGSQLSEAELADNFGVRHFDDGLVALSRRQDRGQTNKIGKEGS